MKRRFSFGVALLILGLLTVPVGAQVTMVSLEG